MKRTPVLIGVAVLAAAAAAVSVASAHARPAAAKPGHVQRLALVVRPLGRGGESVSPSAGNIAVAPGIPVRVTITNYTHEFHTFTVPGLHVDVLVKPALSHRPSKATFTFTAWQSGTFRWSCVLCDHGGPGHRDHMGGAVYVIIAPTNIP
jgi:hypothetical protein